MKRTVNRSLLLQAQKALGAELESMVLIGGAAVDLLAHDLAAPDVRSTTDVDLLVEVITRLELQEVERRLGRQGFIHPLTGDVPICRWQHGALILDVMPTDPTLYGFGNRWSKLAFETSLLYNDGELAIRHTSAPCFVGLKIEAFLSQGRANARDVYASHDLGDILTVLNGRQEAVREILASPPELRKTIQSFFRELSKSNDLMEVVENHILERRRIETVAKMCCILIDG